MMETKQYKKARADAYALLAIHPYAQDRLAEIYDATGDFEHAKKEYQKTPYFGTEIHDWEYH